jgi:ABC-type branched-subunit amino acid transport system substrate-binding protein
MFCAISSHVVNFGVVCSDSASAYASRESVPQISFGSSLVSLSNKNKHPFFARTCPSDGVQANSLALLVSNLGLANISVVSVDNDSFSSSMASIFINE